MNVVVSEATADELDELFAFVLEWWVPSWQLCAGAAPHPTREQLTRYLETGRPILLARDAGTGELWGYRIVATDRDVEAGTAEVRGQALWGLARHEGDPAVVTEAMAELVVEMSVYAWRLFDGPTDSMMMPTRTFSASNVTAQLDALHDRSVAAYRARFGDG